ncbi:hypothetical protein AAG570_013518 [Ranatra chinensis]|uniref:Gustatory receptor n=1 Tax=Ranatra chinensis TaxID=642074 RepID=A0ABD0YCE2_9HEMI
MTHSANKLFYKSELPPKGLGDGEARSFLTTDSASSAMRSVFVVSRLLGVLPQGFDLDRPTYAHSVFMFSLVISVSSYLIYLFVVLNRLALLTVFLLSLGMASVVAALNIAKNSARPSGLYRLVRTLTKTEVAIRRLGGRFRYKRHYFANVTVAILLANVVATTFFIYADGFSRSVIIYQLLHVYIETLTLMVLMQFFTLLHVISNHVSALRRSVGDALELGPPESVQRLESIVLQYNILCDTIGASNDRYSSQLLISLCSSFMMIVYYVYYFISSAGGLVNDGTVCQAFNTELYRQDKLYYATLNPREVSFTAGGYFEIDYPIIISLVAIFNGAVLVVAASSRFDQNITAEDGD